jgi:hypothetical protein
MPRTARRLLAVLAIAIGLMPTATAFAYKANVSRADIEAGFGSCPFLGGMCKDSAGRPWDCSVSAKCVPGWF